MSITISLRVCRPYSEGNHSVVLGRTEAIDQKPLTPWKSQILVAKDTVDFGQRPRHELIHSDLAEIDMVPFAVEDGLRRHQR